MEWNKSLMTDLGLNLYGLYFSTDFMDFKDFCVLKRAAQSLESVKSVEKKKARSP